MINYIAEFITPVTVLFVVIIVGYAIGRIRIFNVSLDLSAVLLTAIMAGFIMSKFFTPVIDENFSITIKAYSNLGTALFVSVVGISSGFSLKLNSKKTPVYVGLGAFTVICGFISFYILKYMFPDFDKSLLLGILCGSLTSTPGLSSACSRIGIVSENAVLGYGASYLIGVSLTVLFVQCVASILKINDNTTDKKEDCFKNINFESYILIGIVVFLGEIISKTSFIKHSVGSTGSILLCGIIIGILINKYPKLKNSINGSFGFFRNFGLILFFVGNGMPAGYSINTNISADCFIFSTIITFTVLVSLLLLCKRLCVNSSQILAVLSGGMTSTPALGVLVKKGYCVDMSAYSLSYLGALLTITIGVNVI